MKRFLWLITGLGSAIAAEEFPEPTRQLSITADMRNKSFPKWQNGHLVVWGYEPPAEALVFDRAGKVARQLSITIPGAEEVNLVNAAVSGGGMGAVTGSARNRERVSTAFIGWINRFGEVERVVRTTPFAPYNLCYAEDGTVWVLGRLLPDPPGSRVELAHDILRQYSPDGRLLRSLLPRDSFPPPDGRHPATGGLLVVSKDLVGVYSVSARQWVELSAGTGEVRGRWPGIPVPEETRVTGLAVTASGTVYLSSQHGSPPKRRTAFYRLDRGQGVWVSVNATRVIGPDPLRPAFLLGADESSLVMTQGSLELLWVPGR